eukprot:XP_024437141.1 G-type lectin S-receptor-like serine/threonine-protein kinase RKS1 [Populus trichocarpa]
MEAEKLLLLFSLIMLHFSSSTSRDSLKTNQTSKEEQTVVWVAKTNDPIIGSSGFLFTNQYGNLVLHGKDDQKLPVWSTNVSVEENDTCAAQLLDSGNLILVRKRSRKTVWQSFDYPTNILLPGMKLVLDRKLGIDRFLTSWRSAEDPGFRDFSVRINPNGSPQFFFYNGKKPISRSPPWPWRSQMDLYKSTFVNDPDEKYFVYTVPDDSYLLRIIVDHPGLGLCGADSTCELTNHNRFGCACLPGFEPKYPKEWSTRDGSGGCVRKRLQTSLLCQHGEGFVKIENYSLPDTSSAA